MAKSNINVVVVVLAALLLIGGLTYALKQAPANKATTSESSLAPASMIPGSNQNTTSSSQPASPENNKTIATLTLNIVEPKNGVVVNSSNLKVSGKTTPNADVFVNDNELTADNAGNFSTTITLDEGDNSVIVSANDENGNYAERELNITYEPSQ